jgi:CrcB protein
MSSGARGGGGRPVAFQIVPEQRRRFIRFDLATALRELASPVVLDPDLEPVEPGAPKAPSLPHALLVFVGGFLGTLARYAVVFHHPAPTGRYDPTILLINATGALVLGILGTTLFLRRPTWTGLRVALATGFLGGWTTYSAIIAGSLSLAHDSAQLAAAVNLGLELVVPVIAAGMGLLAGSLINRWRA